MRTCTLQCALAHCNAHLHTAMRTCTLQCSLAHCNAHLHTAISTCTLQCALAQCNAHLHTAMRTYTLQCALAKKQYSELLDLRTGYRLPWSSISVENFSLYFLADWSLTFAKQMLFRSVSRREDTPPIVVIGLQAIVMTGHK